MKHKFKITNPHGAALIWNYDERTDSDQSKNPHAIEQIVISTASLKSMTTSKTKSAPSGQFEIRLAPTFNWVTRITPGSWCVVLMSQDVPIEPMAKGSVGKAEPETFKMLGRISSVRVAVEVDQDTGTRMTEYIVSGQDWGSVFDTTLYIDPVARNNNLDSLSHVGHAARLVYEQLLLSWTDGKTTMPTSSDAIRGIVNLWGSPLSQIQTAVDGATGSNPMEPQLSVSSQAQFQLPKQVVQFMGMSSLATSASTNFADLIKLVDGKLTGQDEYSPVNEAFGIVNPMSFWGTNTFWQLLVDNSNPILNELITDVRWEGNKPHLALYKRIKPFANRDSFEGHQSVSNIISMFKNLRYIDIPKEEILNVNAGTNWADKVNFIEVKPQPQLNQTNFENVTKLNAQTMDLKAIERDGFKPLIQKTEYMPYDGPKAAPLEATNWKYLMREWYFNTHNMLNGAMSFIGQNKYIQVGDNIRIDASVFGEGPFNNEQMGTQDTVYMLAHVESVSHQFIVNDTGARSFVTTIQFVRGVMVDSANNVIVRSKNKAIDTNASHLDNRKKRDPHVFGTSMPTDPDTDRLKGE